jgi:hypothetical protein
MAMCCEFVYCYTMLYYILCIIMYTGIMYTGFLLRVRHPCTQSVVEQDVHFIQQYHARNSCWAKDVIEFWDMGAVLQNARGMYVCSILPQHPNPRQLVYCSAASHNRRLRNIAHRNSTTPPWPNGVAQHKLPCVQLQALEVGVLFNYNKMIYVCGRISFSRSQTRLLTPMAPVLSSFQWPHLCTGCHNLMCLIDFDCLFSCLPANGGNVTTNNYDAKVVASWHCSILTSWCPKS